MTSQSLRRRAGLAFTAAAAAGLMAVPGPAARLGAAPGQTPSAPQLQSPTFKVEVEYVEVDASVTDGTGAFVRGLTADDFQVFEDGRPQAIVNFSMVDIPIQRYDRPLYSAEPIEPDTASNEQRFEGRVYVMVIDDLHTDFFRTQRVRAAARQFIQTRFGSNDLMAVVHTAGKDEANQEFTNNKRLLLAAVDETVGRKVQSATLSRNDDFVASFGLHAEDMDEPERAYNARVTMQVLESVADWFGSVRGRRKAILFLSEGLDYDLSTVIGSIGQPNSWASPVYDQVQDTIRAAARSNVSIYGIDPRGLSNLADEDITVTSFGADLGQPASLDQAQSIDATQPADASGVGRGSMQAEMRSAQDSLRVLSDETGGFAVVNRNDFTGAFDRLVADNSSYYVLAYYPAGNKRDGKFHKIDVRVKRPGLRVRSRKGYLLEKEKTPAPLDPKILGSREVHEALASPLPISDGVTMRAFAAPFKDAAPNASVLLTTELLGTGLHTEPTDGVEVTYAAVDRKGAVTDGKTDTVRMTNLRPETKARVAATGMRLLNRLTLPPGRYQLRFAARDTASGAIGSVLYDLDVPDFRTEPLVLSGLVLASAGASRWITVRPDAALQPVLPGPPTALRRFARNDEIALFAEVYDNQAAAPHKVDIVTTVTSDEGRQYFKAEEERDSTELGGQNGGYGYAARVPLTDLPPGPYVLTVEAQSRLGAGVTARRQTEFTVLNATMPTQAAAPAAQGNGMQTIDKGVQSSMDGGRQAVVRTESEWAALWHAHDFNRPAPTVDFSQRMVIGVFMGTQPSAGYTVEITDVRDDRGTLVVNYRETRPGPGAVTAQIITSPFHIVSVPAFAGNVRFERVE